MRKTIQTILCRTSALYRNVLRLVSSKNIEKMTLLRLVKNRDVVFDIGANQGDFTVLFADVVGKKGMVHAFEPVSPTYLNLSRRVAQEFHFGNVSLSNFAIGDSPGSFPINVPTGDFGQASLRTHNVGSWAKPGVFFYRPFKGVDLRGSDVEFAYMGDVRNAYSIQTSDLTRTVKKVPLVRRLNAGRIASVFRDAMSIGK